MYDRPSNPSTPQELAIIAWGLIVVLLLLGGVALYYAFQSPPEKVAIAIQLRNIGLASCGLAAVVFGIKTVVQKVLWS